MGASSEQRWIYIRNSWTPTRMEAAKVSDVFVIRRFGSARPHAPTASKHRPERVSTDPGFDNRSGECITLVKNHKPLNPRGKSLMNRYARQS